MEGKRPVDVISLCSAAGDIRPLRLQWGFVGQELPLEIIQFYHSNHLFHVYILNDKLLFTALSRRGGYYPPATLPH